MLKNRFKKDIAGFALVEGILAVVIIAAIIVVGVYVIKQRSTSTAGSVASTVSTQAKPGTSASIDQIIGQEENNETADSGAYAGAVGQVTTSDNASLSAMNGAYNESNL